jgi:nicotinamidase-related amidase
MQIFHAVYLVDAQGRHPAPFTQVTVDDIEAGRWHFNPAVATAIGVTPQEGQAHLRHYVEALKSGGKYDLIIWPYHAMLGGVGHALVPAVEEAVFFHSLARRTQTDFQIKGDNPLTENYSVIGPEVTTGANGQTIAAKNTKLIDALLGFDAIVVAGQAKSHCVAWTVDDLLRAIQARDARCAAKVYLLEDCTSPVVIPNVVDYTEEAEQAYARFAAAGMHRVESSVPMEQWLDL